MAKASKKSTKLSAPKVEVEEKVLPAPSSPAKENVDIASPATTKAKKRKADKVASTPDKKAKVETSNEPKTVTASAGGYTPGALSGLFGKSSASDEVKEVPAAIFQGESKIQVKSKKTSKKAKAAKKAEEEKAEPAKPKDRNEQRENRKKEKGGMTIDEKKVTVFVGNMPLTYDEKMVKKMFSEYGPVESVRMRGVIPTKETLTKRVCHLTGDFHEKQNSVMFYVKFKEAGSVPKALAFNGEEIEGHKIRVDGVEGRKDYDKDHTVFVGNLPFDANEDELSAFFEEAVGGVTFSRIVRDPKSGMGKGFAFVVFKKSTSVDLAIGMSGLEFKKRQIRITKVMKKMKVRKQQKFHNDNKKSATTASGDEPALNADQQAKMSNFKFSTKKNRSADQNERRGLKKGAKKAIRRKATQKQGKSLMK